MLWYKSWVDTRWRFLIGLILLMCSAAGVVFVRPRLMALMPLVPTIDLGGELGRRIQEGAELAREYPGYIWSQWFRQTPTELGTLFAVLLGTGGLLSQASGNASLFTLSLPASRNDLIGVRAAAGLAEWLVLAVAPSLLIPLLSPAVGETYGVGNALVHSVCLFVGGAAFFSLALLLSTVFTDLWRPMLLAVAVAILLGVVATAFPASSRYSIFTLMNGEVYFRTGRLPWEGLLVSGIVSTVMLWTAAINLGRQDF